MCGIAGIWSDKRPGEQLRTQVQNATVSLLHRGPDGEGLWMDEAAGLALGHRRLSILDLSPQGYQPMFSASQRFVIVFNGEIYNHSALKNELSKEDWRGHSDTEILLSALEQWGIKRTLQKAYGMFAFALFDQKEKTLTLARDRMGEKPLYYGFKDGAFVFASELKALFCMALRPFAVDRKALYTFFKYAYIPAPDSILEGIHKLEPGHFMTLGLAEVRGGKLPPSQPYYELPYGHESPLSFEENKQSLDRLLKEVVQEQMATDVPLGAFLSGGIDSSLIVSLMQSLSTRPIKTFSIGFHRKEFNEAPYAKAVAHHLGTDHTELYLTEKETQDIIPRLPEIYDEPFADSSQIPTFLVSQLARQHVTVSLSGDGGDELFGGYDRYILAEKFYKGARCVPPFLREGVSLGIKSFPTSLLNTMGKAIPGCPPAIGDKLHRVASVLSHSPRDFYHHLLTCWAQPPLEGGQSDESPFRVDESSSARFLKSMMRVDIGFYLPNDILVKVDRAAMAASLETRAPFLDGRILDFSQSLPLAHKFSAGKGKHILREVLYTYVPRALFNRPKQGFCVPIGDWMRGELRDWGYALLGTLQDHPFLEASSIKKTWEDHQRGAQDRSQQLWSLFMYLTWYDKYKGSIAL